jgi:hypothetical protein
MPLRAKKPEIEEARFQAVVYANRGVGKTHFCCSFPNSYYIDTEGLQNYPHFVEMLKKNGSEIIRLNDISEIIKEVKELMSTKHEFKTIIIDSITFPFHFLANMEAERLGRIAKGDDDGTGFGKNLAKAKRLTFELGMLLSRTDMNCIVTAHEKVKYEKNVEVGKASDVNDKLEYSLGTVINLRRLGEKVKAHIEKSRYPELKIFETLDFDDGYEMLCNRLGKKLFEREVKPEELATPEQIIEFNRLIEILNVPEEIVQKYIINARATTKEQMNREIMQKTIDHLLNKIKGEAKK